MADKDMSTPKLERHGGQFRHKKRVPADLLAHFDGQKTLTFSTKAGDEREARVECLRWLADLEERFQSLRRLADGGHSVPALLGLTPYELGEVLAGEVIRFKAEKLAADAATAGRGLMGLEGRAASADYRLSILGIDPDSARLALQGFPDEQAPYLRLALRRLGGVGVPLEDSSEAARDAALAFAEAALEVAEVVAVRAAGGFVAAPNPIPRPASALPAPESARTKHRLSEAVAGWELFQKPAAGSVAIYRAAVKLFEELFPDLYAETLTPADVKAFVLKRMGAGKSPATIKKEHAILRVMLSRSVAEGWRTDNPADNVELPKDSGERKRRGYKPAELAAVFGAGVFTKGDRPEAGSGEAAFWIPLLAAFTGARREELAQLETDRVRVEDGFPYLAIDPLDDNGSLKTDESKRAVPLHRELIRLGFLEFVEDRRKEGGGHLFPLLAKNKLGQYSARWGAWWGRYVRDAASLEDSRLSPMHSFRHSVVTDLRQQRIREDEERRLLGHTDRDGRRGRVDSHDGYGEHLVPTLAEVVNLISHRGLDLSGVKPYVSRFNKPGG